MKKIIKEHAIFIIVFIILITLLIIILVTNFQNKAQSNDIQTEENEILNYESVESENVLTSIQEINLHDVNGKGTNYIFTYKDVSYSAIYTKDNWHIVDSYKITNEKDMAIICQALIDIHPIHGKDKISFRTAEDLVYEWVQHNLAYNLLPEDNKWKTNAKDVDLNPEDQGKSLKEMYETRNGKILDKIEKFFNK